MKRRLPSPPVIVLFLFISAALVVGIIRWANRNSEVDSTLEERVMDYAKLTTESDKMIALVKDGKLKKASKLGKQILEEMGDAPTTGSAASKLWDWYHYCPIKENVALEMVTLAYSAKDASLPHYAELAISTAKTGHEHDVSPEYLYDVDILKLYQTQAYWHHLQGERKLSIAALRNGIAYYNEYVYEGGPDRGKLYWRLGELYATLAQASDEPGMSSKDGKSNDELWVEASSAFMSGLPSEKDSPEMLEKWLPIAISESLKPVLRDKTVSKMRIESAIKQLKSVGDVSGTSLSLVFLYSCKAYWESMFGRIKDAVPAFEESIKITEASDPASTMTFHFLLGIGKLSLVSRDRSLFDQTLTRMKNQRQNHRGKWSTVDYDATGSMVAYLKAARSSYPARDAAALRKKLSRITNLSPSEIKNVDLQHVWLSAMLTNLHLEPDPSKADKLLVKIEKVVRKNLVEQYSTITPEMLTELDRLARAKIFGYFWFDDPGPKGPFPPIPKDVSDESLDNLFLFHQQAWWQGDGAAADRVTRELLKRGVSPDFLDAQYWLYEYPAHSK